MVEFELLHEPRVRFCDRAGLADGSESGFWGCGGRKAENVGDDQGCGAGLAHGTGDWVLAGPS